MEDQVRTDPAQTEAAPALPLNTEPRPVLQIEKFTAAELTSLRNELRRGQLDSWQAADLTANFLAGHGYGVSADHLREALACMEMSRCSIDCLQEQLERVAYIQ
jgi:hypothetical protein